LRGFENEVVRRIFGPRRDEETEGKNVMYEKHNDLYSKIIK
jgi:hypothetical protein